MSGQSSLASYQLTDATVLMPRVETAPKAFPLETVRVSDKNVAEGVLINKQEFLDQFKPLLAEDGKPVVTWEGKLVQRKRYALWPADLPPEPTLDAMGNSIAPPEPEKPAAPVDDSSKGAAKGAK